MIPLGVTIASVSSDSDFQTLGFDFDSAKSILDFASFKEVALPSFSTSHLRLLLYGSLEDALAVAVMI